MPLSVDPASEIGGAQVILISDQLDWHARQMCAGYSAHGVAVARVDLADCSFATQSPSGLALGELGSSLPDAIQVRTMSAGSFEAITKRLGVLHALTRLGILVWNEALAIERCVDKSMTSFLLARAGLPTPATWTTERPAEARAIVERELPRGSLVLKPLFGAQGKGLRLIRNIDDLPPAEVVEGVYYLQRFLSSDARVFRDFRLLVVRGRVIAAMMRVSSGWITNIKQGGKPSAFTPDPAMRHLAIAAAKVVGAEIAGVDIATDADGALSVLEVNSMPAWSGLQKVTSYSIAAIIADSLMDELERRGVRRVSA
jgi:RimK family alpha-L-glutamate ligase